MNLRRNEYDVYIGRAGHGQDGIFGNPFSAAKDGGRERAVALYREYFLKRLRIDTEFATRVEELRGKRLGCFCAPKLCHGNVIVNYLDVEPMSKTMKVVVCGDRKWLNIETIETRLRQFPKDAIIIEGGCGGADLLARRIALDIGLEVVEFPAAWKKYGKSAGPIRNIKMLDTGPCLVVAFHNDIKNSRGTNNIVTEARKRGIEVEIIGNN